MIIAFRTLKLTSAVARDIRIDIFQPEEKRCVDVPLCDRMA